MFSCSSSSQSYSLVHCSVLSVSVTASVLYLIPSSSYSLSLFICFPPSLSFITLMKKRGGECSEDIPRGQPSAGRGDAERWRGTESEERGGLGETENMIWCSPAMPTDKILALCKKKKRLESYSKQRGHGEGCTRKFIICSLSELDASPVHMWHSGSRGRNTRRAY